MGHCSCWSVCLCAAAAVQDIVTALLNCEQYCSWLGLLLLCWWTVEGPPAVMSALHCLYDWLSSSSHAGETASQSPCSDGQVPYFRPLHISVPHLSFCEARKLFDSMQSPTSGGQPPCLWNFYTSMLNSAQPKCCEHAHTTVLLPLWQSQTSGGR